MMALVDDQVLIIRDHPISCGDIRQQQGMIDNHHVRALGIFARPVVRARATRVLVTGFHAAILIVG